MATKGLFWGNFCPECPNQLNWFKYSAGLVAMETRLLSKLVKYMSPSNVHKLNENCVLYEKKNDQDFSEGNSYEFRKCQPGFVSQISLILKQ